MMTRTAASLALACLLSLSASAVETDGVDRLAGEDSPLKKGDAIAFFGDSITQGGARPGGYVSIIEQALQKNLADREIKIIPAGISGHKVPDLQKRLDRDVLSKNPTIVFIYIGINDVWHSQNGRGTPKDQFESGLNELIDKMQEADATVVLATPSVIGEMAYGENKLDEMLAEYADISRRVAQEQGVTLCELRDGFEAYLKEHNPDNQGRGILTSDGVHLSADGNKFVANEAAKAIATAAAARDAK